MTSKEIRALLDEADTNLQEAQQIAYDAVCAVGKARDLLCELWNDARNVPAAPRDTRPLVGWGTDAAGDSAWAGYRCVGQLNADGNVWSAWSPYVKYMNRFDVLSEAIEFVERAARSAQR